MTVTSSGRPMNDSDNREFLWKVIGRFDTYIGTTNTKAAGVGALNAFVAGTVISKWTDLVAPVAAKKPILAVDAVLLVLVCCGAIASLLRAIQAIEPNLSSPQAPGKYHSRIFFKQVAEYNTPDDYLSGIRGQTDKTVLEDCANQAYALAALAKQKFDYLQKALWWLRLFVLIPSAGLGLIWVIAVAWRFLNG